MKKRTFLSMALAFAILLSAVFGISALAQDEVPAGEEVVEAQSAELVPEIVSKNVSYGSNLHIYYAIPVSSVAEGSELSVEFYKSAPTDDSVQPAYTITEYEEQEISTITGAPVDYYVIRSRGFAAKNIGDTVWAVPVATDAEGNETRGDAVKYSIAEYCYERLYKAGYIEKTSVDGKDYFRRELYLSVLEYSAAAQQLFYIDKGIDVTLVTGYAYYSLTNAVYGTPYGFATAGDTIAVVYDGEVKRGREFDGWTVTTYVDGVKTVKLYDDTSFTLTIPAGGCTVLPNYIITDPIAVQEEEDEKLVATEWLTFEAAAKAEYGETEGADITSALKTLYTLYDDSMVEWAASLYSRGFMDLESGNWTGGFYASTAGRDTVGYGPDVQCTAQLLAFIVGSGMVNNYGKDYDVPYKDFIPEWMQYEMVYFAKSLQDTSNGYFYHPQWGKAATDARLSRRGRDLGWATSIISSFGETPEVDTPNGKTGNGESANAYLHRLITSGKVDIADAPKSYFTWLEAQAVAESAAYSTDAISSSVAMAVSKVIFAADAEDDGAVEDTTNPEDEEVDSSTAYLKLHTAFIDYLLVTAGPNLDSNPYSMGNTFNATYSQIATSSNSLGTYTYAEGDEESCTDSAKVLAQFEVNNDGDTTNDITLKALYQMFDGLTLKQMTIKFLTYKINPKTGLWGTKWESDNKALDDAGDTTTARKTGTEYAYTNGFFKIITIYNSWGYVYPYPEKAAEAVMMGLLGDEIPSGNICCIYNLWSSVDSIQNNVAKTGSGWWKFDANGDYYSEEYTKEAQDAVNGYINNLLKTRGAEAIINTYNKNLPYCKVDGGKAHSYTNGTTQHQGLPVTPSGYNISDVDGTCIGTTGLVRTIYLAFNLSSTRVSIFTESDWMRFENILETSEPVRKGDPADAQYTFADAEIPEDVSVFAGTVSMTKFENSNALVLEEKLGATMIIDRHGVCNRGEMVSFEANLAFEKAGDYTLNFKTAKGIAVSLIIRVTDSAVTVIDPISGTAYSVSCALGNSFKLKVEISINVDEDDVAHTVAAVYLNDNYYGNVTDYVSVIGYDKLSSLRDIKTAEIVETTEGAIYVDNLTFVIGAVGESTVIFDNLKEGEWGKHRNLPGMNIGHSTQPYAVYSVNVVDNGTDKYLSFDKTAYNDSSNAMTWIVFQNSKPMDDGEEIWFETRMSFANTGSSSSHIRIYSGRTASNGTNGTELSTSDNRLTFTVSSGVVCVGGKSTGVGQGEWFTLRLVAKGTTMTAYFVSDSGETTTVASITNDNMSNMDAVQFTNFSTDISTFNFDKVYFGGDPNIVTDSVSDADIPDGKSKTDSSECTEHVTAVRAENYTEPTCQSGGSYEKVTYCLVCGEVFAERETVTLEKVDCAPKKAKVENNAAPTCTEDGSYYMVVRCKYCNEIQSSEHFTTPATGHTAGDPVKENIVESKCDENGTYDNVVYCADCGDELSRTSVTTPTAPHTFANGTGGECIYCKVTFANQTLEVIDFESYEDGEWAIDKTAKVWFNHIIQNSATAETKIVTENGNKYLSMDKSQGASSSAQTWFTAVRTDEATNGGTVVFQAKIRLRPGSGTATYIRFYEGATVEEGNNGTAFGSDTTARNIEFNISGGVVNVGGKKLTGITSNQWFTLRLVLRGTTVSVWYENNEGTMVHAGDIDKSAVWSGRDLSLANSFVFINNNSTTVGADFDDVYFGAVR